VTWPAPPARARRCRRPSSAPFARPKAQCRRDPCHGWQGEKKKRQCQPFEFSFDLRLPVRVKGPRGNFNIQIRGGRGGRDLPHPSRMEAPPPVPVTQPSVQNLAQREGIKFAGWSGSADCTRWSLLSATEAAGWPSADGGHIAFGIGIRGGTGVC